MTAPAVLLNGSRIVLRPRKSRHKCEHQHCRERFQIGMEAWLGIGGRYFHMGCIPAKTLAERPTAFVRKVMDE